MWVKVLLGPDFVSPASPTLLASSALACRQRKLLKSGWTSPGEARTAKGVEGFWLGRVGSEPLPGTGFLKCGTINNLGQLNLGGCPVLIRIFRRNPGFYSVQLTVVARKNLSRNCMWGWWKQNHLCENHGLGRLLSTDACVNTSMAMPPASASMDTWPPVSPSSLCRWTTSCLSSSRMP